MKWLPVSAIALSSLALPSGGASQELLFDADQWGMVNIQSRQSSAGRLEAQLAANSNFEPLSAYAPSAFLRQLGKPVGRLDIRFAKTGKWTTCTATLVAIDVIITNHHCVPNINRLTIPNGLVDVVTLVMGYIDETNVARTMKYEVVPEPIEEHSDRDIVFLKVRGEPGREWGVATFVPREPVPGEGLLVIHHPGGLPKHVTRGRCRAAYPNATDASKVSLFHLCDTLPGSSGAPIFSDDDNTVIAIHRAGAEIQSTSSVNFGVLLSAIDREGSLIALGEIEHAPKDISRRSDVMQSDLDIQIIYSISENPDHWADNTFSSTSILEDGSEGDTVSYCTVGAFLENVESKISLTVPHYSHKNHGLSFIHYDIIVDQDEDAYIFIGEKRIALFKQNSQKWASLPEEFGEIVNHFRMNKSVRLLIPTSTPGEYLDANINLENFRLGRCG